MRVEVLSPACCGSRRLAVAVRDALERARVDAEFIEVTDYATIATYGVMSVPALAIDGVPVCVGRVPLVTEIVGWLESACHSNTRCTNNG